MSLYKRIWIDRDPAYENYRHERMAEAWQEIAEFKFRIARRRYQYDGKGKSLDRLWPISLGRAVRTLAIDTRNVNDGVLFRTQADCDNVKALAEKIWRELCAEQLA
jgi:hypothetical protein